jgi:hypothetical protein
MPCDHFCALNASARAMPEKQFINLRSRTGLHSIGWSGSFQASEFLSISMPLAPIVAVINRFFKSLESVLQDSPREPRQVHRVRLTIFIKNDIIY